tara:strand:+ start:1763 stop:1960 length:198 start_codon:yes stop_codon:yes gene_type:complete
MEVDILNKILLFLLILSILTVTRNAFFLLKSFREEEKFLLNRGSLLILGVSISYIIMTIIDGVKF